MKIKTVALLNEQNAKFCDFKLFWKKESTYPHFSIKHLYTVIFT